MILSKIAINNLEKQRKLLGLKESDIDKYAELEEGTYLKVIRDEIELSLNTLQNIVEKVFNSKVKEYLNSTFKAKPLSSLSETLQLIVAKNNTEPSYGPLPNYLTLIIHYKLKINDEFSNKLFKENLPIALKEQKIELKKYTLRNNINAIEGATEEGTHKNFNQFVYTVPFNDQQITRARKKVNVEWLKELEKTPKRNN